MLPKKKTASQVKKRNIVSTLSTAKARLSTNALIEINGLSVRRSNITNSARITRPRTIDAMVATLSQPHTSDC
jgi:hypothetical protein